MPKEIVQAKTLPSEQSTTCVRASDYSRNSALSCKADDPFDEATRT